MMLDAQALQIYDQCIRWTMNRPHDDHINPDKRITEKFDPRLLLRDESLQYLRGAIYVQLIRQKMTAESVTTEDPEIAEWIHVLFNVIPHERHSLFGLNRMTHRLAHQQLQVMLCVYGERERDRVIEFFREQLLRTGSFGMWRKYKYGTDTKWILDLHLMTFEITRFVLRYVFEYEREHIENGLDKEDLYILCGSAKHRKTRVNAIEHEEEYNITFCVIDELKTWSPPQ